jgi:glycosyltransferase involved in cell wall biosynthesis
MLPELDPQKNEFFYLSRYLEGDFIAPLWNCKTPKAISGVRQAELAMANFKYHPIFESRLQPWLPKGCVYLRNIVLLVARGLYIYYFLKKYDVIFVWEPFQAGIAGYILKLLTGRKLIVMIPGEYIKSRPDYLGISLKLYRLRVKALIPLMVKAADHLLLVAPNLLEGYSIDNKSSSFPNFVSVGSLMPPNLRRKYILFLGYPWRNKGVDLLIKAFKLISDEFPEYHLKVVGHCPDRSPYYKLAEGNNRIEFYKGTTHDEAMRLMSECTLFVLPSRSSEGMPRVLIEAMAMRIPLIASNVGGTPSYIKNGFNGLIFESENYRELADKIRFMLVNPDYAAKFVENGYNDFRQNFTEERYAERFSEVVEKTLSPKKHAG